MKHARTYHTRSRDQGTPPSYATAATAKPPKPLISSATTLRPSSPSAHPTPVQSKLILPVPMYIPVDHTKKSHARKQPAGHIPRPRNAFILFRCNFVDQDKIPSSVEKDHRNISRIVGSIWRKMSDSEKEPWVRMADDEKRAHFLAYPGYRFSRALASTARPAATRLKRGDDTASSRGSSSPKSTVSIPQPASDASYLSLPVHDDGHSSSCPSGAPHISTASWQDLGAFPETIVTRDELARRPSRVMLSESAHYEDFYSVFDDIHSPGGYNMKNTEGMDQYISDGTKEISNHDWQAITEDRYRSEAQSNGPRLNAIRMPMPGMDNPSQLDIVDTWDEFYATQRRQASTPPRMEHTPDTLEYSTRVGVDSIDLDLSPTLPPLPLLQAPESSEEEYYYPAAASPIERKNSFYSPGSGTWKLPLPIMSSNPGAGAGFSSVSHIDSSMLFPDNLIGDELRYPDANDTSERTRASSSWSFDAAPSSFGSSAYVNEHQMHCYEEKSERGGPRSSPLFKVETLGSASASKNMAYSD